MTPENALSLVRQAAVMANMPLSDHQQVQQALMILEGMVKSQQTNTEVAQQSAPKPKK